MTWRESKRRPGIVVGRLQHGKARWDWSNSAHLLMIEELEYGNGESRVRQIYRDHRGPKVCLDPKDYYWPRGQEDLDHFGHMDTCIAQLNQLGERSLERMAIIKNGGHLDRILVTIPELHDVTDSHGSSLSQTEFMDGLAYLLKHGRAARIHVLANVRQHVITRGMLPPEVAHQFSSLLVFGPVTRGRYGYPIPTYAQAPAGIESPYLTAHGVTLELRP